MENLSRQEKAELFRKTAACETDRVAFAAAITGPLLKSIERESTVRRIFMTDELPEGASSNYPIDASVDGGKAPEAIVMPARGQVPQNILVGEELFIPTFEIASSAEYKIQYARHGRFDVAERAIQKIKDEIIGIEDAEGWSVIRAAISADNTVNEVEAEKGLTKTNLNAGFKKMESNRGYKVTLICANAYRIGDIRDWTSVEIDPVTQREIFRGAGLLGLWNAEIVNVPELGNDEVYMFDTSKFGIMPIRANIQIYDNPEAIKRLRIGIIAFEEVGFAAVDRHAVVKLALT